MSSGSRPLAEPEVIQVCWYVASLGNIRLIPSQWFGVLVDVWNHYSDVIIGAMASPVTASHCLLNRLFRRRSKKTSKLRITGPCAGNSPVTGEFPAQMANSAENVSICWRHHVIDVSLLVTYSQTRTYIYVQNLLAVWSGIHVLQRAVSLYEEKWCEVEHRCVFTYRHIYTWKKSLTDHLKSVKLSRAIIATGSGKTLPCTHTESGSVPLIWRKYFAGSIRNNDRSLEFCYKYE